jgi:hypothetical protein
MNRTTARATVPPILAACVIALILEAPPDPPPPPDPAPAVERP